ncbi:molecular chaperone TorD family protein [Cupriavidus basilensis]
MEKDAGAAKRHRRTVEPGSQGGSCLAACAAGRSTPARAIRKPLEQSRYDRFPAYPADPPGNRSHRQCRGHRPRGPVRPAGHPAIPRAPDAALLHHIAANRAHGEDATDARWAKPWNGLCDAASATTAAQAADEYQQLFIGVGKPEVFLYGSYYQTGFLN